MESHGWTMVGPLNTDNIRAQDGTLAATIDDATGKVNFVGDVDVAGAFDVQTNARVFQNLEVQGPLASFLQSISVGTNASITNNLTVGVDADIGQDLDVGRDVDVIRNVAVGDRLQTVNMRMTGSGPAAGKLLTAVDGSGNVTWGSGGTAGIASVPTGESILFYSNDTILGYTLETLIADDDVVYITKGTLAGGQAGGAMKPLSTWTQPTHVHAAGAVGGWHNHQWYDEGGTRNTWQADGITTQNFSHDDSSGGVVCEANDDEAFNRDGYTERVWVSLSGNVDPGATTASWRPKGHNFTLQTRL